MITVSLITVLLMAAIILWMHRGYKKAELVRVSSFTVEDGAEFVGLGKNIIRYSGNGAVCMDRRGNIRWHVTYKMQQPVISISGDVIAIANRSGYNVYVMNTQGLLGTIETRERKSPISSRQCPKTDIPFPRQFLLTARLCACRAYSFRALP